MQLVNSTHFVAAGAINGTAQNAASVNNFFIFFLPCVFYKNKNHQIGGREVRKIITSNDPVGFGEPVV